MGAQYTSVTVTWTSGGTTQSTTMLQAEYAADGPASFRKWYVCHVCALSYPEGEGILDGGVFYCFRNKCYQDLESRCK